MVVRAVVVPPSATVQGLRTDSFGGASGRSPGRQDGRSGRLITAGDDKAAGYGSSAGVGTKMAAR
jgi:hypothetical protein